MERPKKRPRPTLSCRECRQKKLRCDRAQPCQQCVKGQRETFCVFDAEPSSRQSASETPENSESQTTRGRVSENERMERQPTSASASQGRNSAIEDLQARVASLEAVISANQAPLNRRNGRAQRPPLGTLSLKGDRCRYYGNGFQCGLFDRVQSMAMSILQPSTDPDLWSLAKDVQGLTKRQDADMASLSTSAPDTLNGLRDRLPEKDVCRCLIQTYFSMYEERLVVLHEPTFIPLFSDFMDKLPQSSSVNSNSRVEAQIYAAMGLAASHLHSSNHPHQAAARQWLRLSPYKVIETWLNARPRKARAEVSILQTRALIILFQQANGQHIEEHWQSTNALVRSAMVLGLHRDPAQFPSFSPLQADLRRRLWWSIVEMDLSASLSYGMPPALCPEDTDCIPSVRPDSLDLRLYLSGSCTRDSCFVLQDFLVRSLLGRLAIVNMVSHTLDHSSRIRLKQLWDEVEDVMKDLPRPVDPAITPADVYMESAITSIKSLRNTLVISVQRSLSPENMPSAEGIRGAAEILSSLVLVASGNGETNKPEPDLSKFLVEFMHSINKAMTLVGIHLDRCQDTPTMDDPFLEAASLFQLLEKSLQVFVRSVALEHTSLKSILALSISASLAKARSNREVEKNAVREGLMETLASLKKRLSETAKSAEQSGSFTMSMDFYETIHSGMRSESALSVDTIFDWPSSDWLFDFNESWI